jgi:glycosidase
MNADQERGGRPCLYQVNTRTWLTEISRELGRPAALDDIPDESLDRIAGLGFNWVWFLSVWKTGEQGRKVSLENRGWRAEFEETLPDLQDSDIGGSGFAIADYRVSPAIGGSDALRRLRSRLRKRGLSLMLDFVPNHMGPDHPWAKSHPEYFVSGTEEDLVRYPRNYIKLKQKGGDVIAAYGRDPYFDGWPDTLQLDYSNPAAAAAMAGELERISSQCDGVRCDMAMLILPSVFERTWGRPSLPFWPDIIAKIHERNPSFRFMAEVYWDMEWELQQLGFDFTYDKRLYDRLREGHAVPVREHFYAGLDYQEKMARFLENHDEPRAASTFGTDQHKAAAVITFCSPGLRFFHQGQLEGRKKRISPHLVRAPIEEPDPDLQEFYADLLSALRRPEFRGGEWRLLECIPAWEGNDSWNSFLVFSWTGGDGLFGLAAVNYSPGSGQCYVRMPALAGGGLPLRFIDLLSGAVYDRDADELRSRGLYLDMSGWGCHMFTVSPASD